MREVLEKGCLAVLLFLSLQAAARPGVVKLAEVQAMAALLVYDPRLNLPERQVSEILNDFSRKLTELKAQGVTAISVDLWRGIVQRNGAKPDWKDYDLIFARIIDAKLKIVIIDSDHASGGNVGDGSTYIPQPKQVADSLSTMSEGLDAAYKSETGNRSVEVISSFATHARRTPGRMHPLDRHAKYFEEFREHFAPMAEHIQEIIIGLGPAGELTYPSYHQHDVNFRWNGVKIADYPARGALQASSLLARSQFYRWLHGKYSGGTTSPLEKLNQTWNSNYKSYEDIDFFVTTQKFSKFIEEGGVQSPAGRDFFNWYNSSLFSHGTKVLNVAAQTFKGSPFEDTILAVKIPGIHWSFDDRLALLTAGQISLESPGPEWEGEDGFGYARSLSQLFRPLVHKHPNTKWKVIFTCADQPNCALHSAEGSGNEFKYDENGRQTHGAWDLVRGVGRVLQKLGVRGGLENSLSFLLYQSNAVQRMYSHLAEIPIYESVTLLRMDEVLWSPQMKDFVNAVKVLPKSEAVLDKKMLCYKALTK